MKLGRVQVFTPSGEFKHMFAGGGRSDGCLQAPFGCTTDNQGNIVIADFGNDRIQIFDAKGKWLRKFGQRGSQSGHIARPAGVAVDFDDLIYVAEMANHRIQVPNLTFRTFLFVSCSDPFLRSSLRKENFFG